MKPGMVGPGRMGANMVQRLRQGAHDCVVLGGQAEKDAARQGGG
jgi:6-phosphogluconate dehydrogenase (decarboxylating)